MKVYVMFADGFEEIEALSIVDVLRRGEVDTVMVSIKSDKIVVGAHKIPIVVEKLIEEVEIMNEDMIVLPGGGKGVEGLSESGTLREILIKHQEQNGLLSAICAGPMVPGKLGFYKGIRATCYPGCEGDLTDAIFLDDDVVVDKNFITSKGPATALLFSFKLLEIAKNKETAEKIMKGMLFNAVN